MFASQDIALKPIAANYSSASRADMNVKKPRSSSIGEILRSIGGILDQQELATPLLERSILWIFNAYRVPMEGVVLTKTLQSAWHYTGFRDKDLPTLLQNLANRGDVELVVNEQRQALVKLTRLGFNRMHLLLNHKDSQTIRSGDQDPAYSGLRSDPYNVEKNSAAGNLAIQRFFHSPMGSVLRTLGFFDHPEAGINLAVQTLLRMIEQFPQGYRSGFTRNDLGTAWAQMGLRLKDLDEALELMSREKLITGQLEAGHPTYQITQRGEREIRRYQKGVQGGNRTASDSLKRDADRGLIKEVRTQKWLSRLPFIEKVGEFGLIAIAFVLAAWVFTLPVENYVEVGSTVLSSNGSGKRTAARGEPAWIDGLYNVEIFVQKTTDNAQELINQPGTKRIQVTANRDIRDGKLVDQLLKEVRQYLLPQEYATLFQEVPVLRKAVATHGVKGAKLIADFRPNHGMALWIDQNPILHINDKALFDGFLKVWVGDRVPDSTLKRKLLGDRFGFKISTTAR